VNRDEIIRMVREARLWDTFDDDSLGALERFAALVAAAERNNVHTCHNDCQRPACVAVREAVEAEREACAKMCEEISDEEYYLGRQYADMIRARGDK
jgi:hypothetical protein